MGFLSLAEYSATLYQLRHFKTRNLRNFGESQQKYYFEIHLRDTKFID